MFERMERKTLMKWLIVAVLVYLLLPWDLLPDILGIVGRLDDVLMLAWLAWYYRNHVREYVAPGFEHETAGRSPNSGQGASVPPERGKIFEAYEVLGITQNLAHEKSQQIQQAYRHLRG
jgi:hypothetical protein